MRPSLHACVVQATVRASLLSALAVWPFGTHAGDGVVRARIALVDGRSTFVAGEPIAIDLFVETDGDPVPIKAAGATDYEVDDVEIAPTDGVFAWRAEKESYEPRSGGDVITMPVPLRSLRRRLSIDARYRFDRPGVYTVRVRTARAGQLESNAITLTIEEASAEVQAARIAEAANTLRTSTVDRERRSAAATLNREAGATATDAKLSLLVGREASRRYAALASDGLWIARDRRRIVDALDAAVGDAETDPIVLLSVVDTLADLRTSLDHPVDGAPSAHVPGPRMIYPTGAFLRERLGVREQLWRRLASTIPSRDGRSRVDAARVALTGLHFAAEEQAGRVSLDDPDVRTARDAILAYEDSAHPAALFVDLPREEALFDDVRMIPKLHRALDASGALAMSDDARGPAVRMLNRLEPSSTMTFVVREACARQPVKVAAFAGRDVAPSTVVDHCLAAKVAEETAANAPPSLASRIDLSTMSYIARFATCALTSNVAALYPSLRENTRHLAASDTALAYLVRCDAARYGPWLDAAADANDTMLTFYLVRASTPPADNIRTFLRDRIARPPSKTSSQWVYALWQLNDATDARFLRERLAGLREESGASPEKVQTEAAIEQALQRGMVGASQIP